MHILLMIAVAALLFAAASLLAVLSYGHFARRARGEETAAFDIDPAFTILDTGIGKRVEEREGRSGLTLVSANLDAFAIRALAARAAGRSLDLMYYYWKDDLTGRLLIHEVLRAADRGVRVRLLVDDINTRGKDRVYLTLDTHPNISVRLFNPSRARSGGLRRGVEMVLRAFSVTRRMHNKAWIADGRLAIVGGRNIGDEYFDAAETSNFRDSDMVMVGPIVREVEDVFDDFWNSEVTMPIRSIARRRKLDLDALRAVLAATADGERARPYMAKAMERISLMVMFDSLLPVHWTSQVRIVADPPEKALNRQPENWIMSSLRPAMASAEDSLWLTSPYFVPGTDGVDLLTRLSASGVDVAVLTNSLAATDVAAVHGGYAPYRKALLAGGVRLHELQPFLRRHQISLFGSRGASLHTKAFTVDDHTAFVGSFNFDPRSASLNTEMGVLFVERDIVATLRELFEDEASPQMSYRVFVAEDGRLRWAEEVDGNVVIHDREPEARAGRRLVAAVISWLPIESQL
ncbi:phospholipase D family protein [Mesorhizobium sp. CAU 1741]|uniref:phospholipase D family protein n=1 Tax=Mesorhizobium sp. CAU 1741 TaxID=3140366 RepID=UPI00325A99B0